MKKLLIILTALLFVSLSSEAQIRWPFGGANTVTGGTNDTLDISSQLSRGMNNYVITNDTNMVINVTTVNSNWEFGDLLIISATEGTANADTIRYGTNITGTATPIPSGKTKIITFLFNATAWVKISEQQID